MISQSTGRGRGSLVSKVWLGLILAMVSALSITAGEARVRLRLALDLWAGYYPAFLAAERGQFAAAGLAVEIELPQDTKRSLAELAAGEYDAVGASLSDFFPVFRQDPGARLVLLSDESAGGDAILSRSAPGSDLAKRQDAIRGKRIGTNLGGFGEIKAMGGIVAVEGLLCLCLIGNRPSSVIGQGVA
jgi:NitT/TauT family transport system substrate-binding protein